MFQKYLLTSLFKLITKFDSFQLTSLQNYFQQFRKVKLNQK